MWTEKRLKYVIDYWRLISSDKIGRKINKTSKEVTDKAKELQIDELYQREFAIYHGDEFLCYGTLEHCAQYLNVKVSTVEFMRSKQYQERSKTGYRCIYLGRWLKSEWH